MMNVGIQMVLYCMILAALSLPLCAYIGKVMNGERVLLSPVLAPVEQGIYRLLRIEKEEDMDWKRYAVCTGVFSLIKIKCRFTADFRY